MVCILSCQSSKLILGSLPTDESSGSPILSHYVNDFPFPSTLASLHNQKRQSTDELIHCTCLSPLEYFSRFGMIELFQTTQLPKEEASTSIERKASCRGLNDS